MTSVLTVDRECEQPATVRFCSQTREAVAHHLASAPSRNERGRSMEVNKLAKDKPGVSRLAENLRLEVKEMRAIGRRDPP